MSKINKTPIETRLAIERRSAAMLPDRPTQAGLKPWDIRNALFTAIIADKGACLMGEIDRIVDEANAAIDAIRIKSGTLTVSTAHWKGTEPPRAACAMGGLYTAGCAVIFMPEDDETKEQAGLARLSMAINETMDGEWSDVVVFVGEGGKIPSVDLHFRYIVIPTESKADAIVALVGVDAYGEGGTASGVDEEAVKEIISKEVPEWARAQQKPEYTAEEVKARPDTWTPTAAEIGARPNTWTPTAGEVGADSAGTAAGKVKDHNEDGGSHVDIRLDVTTIRSMLETVIGTDTGKSMRAVAALVVAEIVGDASDSFDTLEEIAAWIESHPNDVAAMVKRITDLETAMGGKVSKTDIINTLDNTALDKPLSAAMGAKLKAILEEVSDEIDGKPTTEQVSKAISDALAGYAPKDHEHDGTYAKPSDIPTVPQTLPNPYALNLLGKTYNGASAVSLTVEEIMEAIKTASGGVIAWIGDNNNIILSGSLSGGTYTAYYELTNSDGTKSLVEIGELILGEEETPEPEPVTYTVTFVADGVTVATVTYEAGATSIEEPTVPAKDGYTGAWADYDLSQGGDIIVNAVYTEIGGEATTHTVTWVDDDGTVLEIDTVADGDTPEYNGAAPATTKVVGEEDPYTYNFVGWTPKVGAVNADTTYKVTYADWGYKSGYRIRSSGAEAAQAGVYCTDYIPVSYDDTVYIKGVTKHATTGYNSIVFYKTDGDTQIAFTDFTNEDLSYDSKNDIYSFKVWSGFISALTENCGVARFRFSCGGISEDTIITVNESIE